MNNKLKKNKLEINLIKKILLFNADKFVSIL